MTENETRVRVSALRLLRASILAVIIEKFDELASVTGQIAFMLAQNPQLIEEETDMVLAQSKTPTMYDDARKAGSDAGILAALGLGPQTVGPEGLKVTIAKSYVAELARLKSDVQTIGANEVTMYELGANKVESSNVSEVGYLETASIGALYVRFKGGSLYRYWPFGLSQWAELASILVTMSKGGVSAMTVGQYVNNVIKPAHESGLITCEKLSDDGAWSNVLNKAQKAEAGVKPKKRATKSSKAKKETPAEVPADAPAQQPEVVAPATEPEATPVDAPATEQPAVEPVPEAQAAVEPPQVSVPEAQSDEPEGFVMLDEIVSEDDPMKVRFQVYKDVALYRDWTVTIKSQKGKDLYNAYTATSGNDWAFYKDVLKGTIDPDQWAKLTLSSESNGNAEAQEAEAPVATPESDDWADLFSE